MLRTVMWYLPDMTVSYRNTIRTPLLEHFKNTIWNTLGEIVQNAVVVLVWKPYRNTIKNLNFSLYCVLTCSNSVPSDVYTIYYIKHITCKVLFSDGVPVSRWVLVLGSIGWKSWQKVNLTTQFHSTNHFYGNELWMAQI